MPIKSFPTLNGIKNTKNNSCLDYIAKSDAAIVILDRDNDCIYCSNIAFRLLQSTDNSFVVQKSINLDGGVLIYLGSLPSIAERASEVSMLVHQLKAPLTATKWLLEDLEENWNLNREQKGKLEDLHQSNQFAINLTNDVMESLRLESGILKVSRVAADIQKLVEDVIKILRPNVEKKRQRIILRVIGIFQPTFLDPSLFSRIFVNLLDNAVNYGEINSDIAINISCDNKEKKCVVSVNNKGLPISEKDKDKIFSKFYRCDEAKKINPIGSGLGLYIARAAAVASGGKIWFESNTENGTTFSFMLPVGEI